MAYIEVVHETAAHDLVIMLVLENESAIGLAARRKVLFKTEFHV
jgi:hypothetical protein